MLKKILSVSDVKKLKVGDALFDHPEHSLAKPYFVRGISRSSIYLIHDDQHQILKLLKTNEVPDMSWWIREEAG